MNSTFTATSATRMIKTLCVPYFFWVAVHKSSATPTATSATQTCQIEGRWSKKTTKTHFRNPRGTWRTQLINETCISRLCLRIRKITNSDFYCPAALNCQFYESEELFMTNYPLKKHPHDKHFLTPISTSYSEDYMANHYNLYLTEEYTPNDDGHWKWPYRLHSNEPHTIEMALAYDILCPRCKKHFLKQIGRCRDCYMLGLYECPSCDR